jgi:hypothetical protein
MRDLTREEIEEYLHFASTDREAANFQNRHAQGKLIGDAVARSGVLEAMGRNMVRHAGGPAELCSEEVIYSMILSLWVSAFQMGRECESRLLTLALKGKRSV